MSLDKMKIYSSALFVLGLAIIPFMLGGCQDDEKATIQVHKDSILTVTKEPETVYTYRCDDGYQFQVKLKADHVVLLLPDKQMTLPQVPSGSGVRYANDLATFWTKDREAMVTLKNKQHLNCHETSITHTNSILKFR
jgi:membrane-bound inhibitor of C-type lysozyme